VLWISVAVVVVLALIAGGLVITLRPNHQAPAPAAVRAIKPSPTPTAPRYGTNPDGTHYGPLTSFLLPMPSGYEQGPDVGYYGNDGAITPQQIATTSNEAVREFGAMLGLPNSLINKNLLTPSQVAELVRGAVVSYAADNDNLDVSIVLEQFARPSYASESGQNRQQMVAEFSKLFGRSTFVVPGFPHARCGHPMPVMKKLDELQCFAISGDVVTNFDAEGVAPISQQDMTTLVAKQLKLLQAGGETA
jgi:hypothetical protein